MASMPDMTILQFELSRRDYIATHIMAAGMASAVNLGALEPDELQRQFGVLADICYLAADALIKAGEK